MNASLNTIRKSIATCIIIDFQNGPLAVKSSGIKSATPMDLDTDNMLHT